MPVKTKSNLSTLKRPTRLKLILFTSIGIFNTLFDIALYVIILNISHSIIIANILATSAALIGSYLLNSKLTFKSKKWTAHTFILFVVVTVFGLWVIQTGAIYGLNHLIHYVPEHDWRKLGGFEKLAKQLVPKLLATSLTLVWNYIWYNKVIFKPEEHDDATHLAFSDL
jgi:putative flippase GtrA